MVAAPLHRPPELSPEVWSPALLAQHWGSLLVLRVSRPHVENYFPISTDLVIPNPTASTLHGSFSGPWTDVLTSLRKSGSKSSTRWPQGLVLNPRHLGIIPHSCSHALLLAGTDGSKGRLRPSNPPPIQPFLHCLVGRVIPVP